MLPQTVAGTQVLKQQLKGHYNDGVEASFGLK
jgi:hypothetical protein